MNSTNRMDRGVLLIATGHRQYVQEALDLAISLRLHSPNLPVALVTDRQTDSQRLNRTFSHVIPYRPDFGEAFSQKLFIDEYSPFSRTLFLDTDCLVTRSIEFVFEMFADHSFVIPGRAFTTGTWYGFNITEMMKTLNVNWIPRMNTGMIYFEVGDAALRVFSMARDFLRRGRELGVQEFREGHMPDEPAFGFAMAALDVPPVDDKGLTMRHTTGIDGRMTVDVIGGRSRFQKNGRWVRPAIVHFGRRHKGHVLIREARRVRLFGEHGFPAWIARPAGSVYGLARLIGAGPRIWMNEIRTSRT